MICRLIGLVLACALPVSLALAQTPSGSRLDDIMKSGKLRVCTPGDYKPFSLARPDGTYEGIDIDLMQSAAKALGVQIEMVKTAWPKLMDDFLEKCDIGVGGISVSTDRALPASPSPVRTVRAVRRPHRSRQGVRGADRVLQPLRQGRW